MKEKRNLDHRQVQARHLRKLAERCDKQMIKLAHRKNKLLAMAANLEAKSEMPKDAGKVTKIGFR